MPLILQRIELMSPRDGKPLVYQALLPNNRGIKAGPLGGIHQAVPFAPYDAIYREALTSSSPFYRLLCGARMFEGTGTIRKWLKQQCKERDVVEKMPSEIHVDPEFLRRVGLEPRFVAGVRTAQDLYHKLQDLRNGIAHFLIEQEGADMHVYLAEGAQLHIYSTAAAALLHYAHVLYHRSKTTFLNLYRHQVLLRSFGSFATAGQLHRVATSVRGADPNWEVPTTPPYTGPR